MGAVAEAFAAYVETAISQGATPAEYLASGLDPGEVRRRLAEAGIQPHESVVEWFSVVNGLQENASGPALFQGREVATVDAAIADYLDGIAADEEDEPAIYRPEWFPLTLDKGMAVVHATTGEVIDVDLELGARVIAPSLAAWIDDQVQLIPVHEEWSEFGHHILFEPGTTGFAPRDRYYLDNLVPVLRLQQPPQFRILHAPVGSVPGNEQLEETQARRVAEHLIGAGAPLEGLIEFVVVLRSVDSPPQHVVGMAVPG